MTIEHKLDVKEINNPDYQTKQDLTGTKGFFNKAKYFLALPLIAITIACSTGYKQILDKKNVQIYMNRDGSSIIMKTQESRMKRTYVFSGEPLQEFEIDPNNLTLVKYIKNPEGAFNTKKYNDPDNNVVDEKVLEKKQKHGRKLLEDHHRAIYNFLKK